MSGMLNEALERMLEQLRAHRHAIDAEIEQLQMLGRMAAEPTPDFILGLYITLGSATAAADFANAQGWRLPSKKGPGNPPRQYQPPDVYALLRGQPNAIGEPTPAVRETASRALRRKNGWWVEALHGR